MTRYRLPVSEQQDAESAQENASLQTHASIETPVETADPEATRSPARLRLRRAPRYGPFGLTGAGIGILAGVILALSFSATSDYSIQTIAGYFAAILGLIGAVLGLALAVLIERRRA